MGLRMKSSQDLLTRERSLSFLDGQERNGTVLKNKSDIRFARARVEYYYGSVTEARQLFFTLILHNPLRVSYYRYLFPTLLGATFIATLRKSNRYRAVTPLLHRLPFARKYFLP
jgi:hypothetical protein